MKRLLAYLCAVALAWAPALNAYALSDALKLILFKPTVVASGSVTRDVNADASAEDATTLSTGNVTIASTSGRFAIAMALKDEGAETFTSASIGGEAMTALAAQTEIGFNHTRPYSLVNPTAGASKVFTVVPSAIVSWLLVSGVVYNGVNQSTPINHTPTPTTGSFNDPDFGDPFSITVTTVTGGKAVAFLAINNDALSAVTITPDAPSVVVQQETVLFGTVAILERDNNGGSTTISGTITVTGGNTEWRMDAYGIQP